MAATRCARALLASSAPVAADPNGQTIFPFGTHVYREPSLTLEQLRSDFAVLKRLGFTMVKKARSICPGSLKSFPMPGKMASEFISG